MIRNFLLIPLFLYVSITMAKIYKHETIDSHLSDFSYQDFCETMKAKSTTLVSALPQNEIECFNEKYKIIDFCLKKLPLGSSLSRGFAVTTEKKVYCEVAKSVMVSLTCDTQSDLCKNPKQSCLKMQKFYAYDLDLAHASQIERNLNCYYSKKIGENINESLEDL